MKRPTLDEYVDQTQLKLAAAYNSLQSKTIREPSPGEFREPMEAIRDAMRALRMLEIRTNKATR